VERLAVGLDVRREVNPAGLAEHASEQPLSILERDEQEGAAVEV
jgi:hypothetical protein